MFIFNIVVFYLPLAFLVFDTTNPEQYKLVSDAMLSQMLFKQMAYNLQEYFTPIILYKPALDKLKHKFWKVRAIFYDDENLEYFAELEGEPAEAVQPLDEAAESAAAKSKAAAASIFGLGAPTPSTNKVAPSAVPEMDEQQEDPKADSTPSESESDEAFANAKTSTIRHAALQGKQKVWLTNARKRVKAQARRAITMVERDEADGEQVPPRPSEIRRYQAMRDIALDPTKFEVIDSYMELVVQFGFIAIFSSFFPLGPVLSFFANQIQYSSQTKNLIYMRRQKAEVSDGIGAWLDYLELMCILAVIFNSLSLYFTSQVYQATFAGVDYYDLVRRINLELKDNEDPNSGTLNDAALLADLKNAGSGVTSVAAQRAEELQITTAIGTWDVLAFLIAVVVLEHILLLVIMAMSAMIEDIPESVVAQSINAEKIMNIISDPEELRKKQIPHNQDEIVTNTRDSNLPIAAYRMKTPQQICEKLLREGASIKSRDSKALGAMMTATAAKNPFKEV